MAAPFAAMECSNGAGTTIRVWVPAWSRVFVAVVVRSASICASLWLPWSGSWLLFPFVLFVVPSVVVVTWRLGGSMVVVVVVVVLSAFIHVNPWLPLLWLWLLLLLLLLLGILGVLAVRLSLLWLLWLFNLRNL